MNKKGFTLVEIIAVIVIMGILLLIVVPTTTNLMRSNEEKEYQTYYGIVQEGLEKYARTRRNEIGGSTGYGCLDDKDLSDMIRLGYVKEFDQEDDVICGTPSEFDNGLLSSWGVNTSKTYANMRVEGNQGKVTVKLSLICVKLNSDDTYAETPEYIKLVEAGACDGSGSVTPPTPDPTPDPTPEVYTITYNYDGGTAPLTGVPSTYTYGVGATINGVPTKPNYVFNGWNNGATTKMTHTISTTDTGNKSYTAKWCRNCAATGGASCTLDATSTPGTCKYTTKCPTGYTISNNGKYNPSCTNATYTITLNGNGATTAGSTSTTVKYLGTALGAITIPKREYTVTFNTNGTGATSSASSTKATYTFNGWYTAASGGYKVASNAATPALQASISGYTNGSKQWTKTSGATLYSQWTSKSITLATIKRTGYNCNWNTKSGGTGTSYSGGTSYTPTSNITLYARCSKCDGWSGSGTSWYYYQNGNYLRGNDGKARYNEPGTAIIYGQWLELYSDAFSDTCAKGTNKETYYLKDNGETFVGWLRSGSYWYYLEPGDTDNNGYSDCNMAHDWPRYINGKWYDFDDQGRCKGCSTRESGPYIGGYNCSCSA